MILTEGDRLVLTPTYHVFDLYQAHQGARAVRATFDAPPIGYAAGERRQQMPGLSGSASVNEGVLTVSIVNPRATLPIEATVELRGAGGDVEADARVLTHDDITAHNTFDDPAVVEPAAQPVRLGSASPVGLKPASVSVLRCRLR